MAVFSRAVSFASKQPWFAVCTRPTQERAVSDYLANREFRVFSPQYAAPSGGKWSRRHPIPVFPGYVFVQGGMERKNTILTTPGVYTIVCVGFEPAEIPRSALETVRRALDSSLHLEPRLFAVASVHSQQQVALDKGPLAGAIGAIQQTGTACELIVSIELIEKSVAIRIDPTWLAHESNSPNQEGARHALTRAVIAGR